MKTPITFTKEDILKLVCAFLRRRGFVVPGPEKISYKGALQVTVNLEMDLPMAEIEEALGTPAAVAPRPAASAAAAEVEEEAETDMGSILQASRAVARRPPPFKGGEDEPVRRQLGAEEYEEYPGDKR